MVSVLVKLHLASGSKYKEGWINADVRSDIRKDIHVDLNGRFPWADNSADFIYSEHFIEHITEQQGLNFLKECHRVLKVGGVIRVATPDLEWVVERYWRNDWRNEKWLTEVPQGASIKTRAQYLNIGMREWDHQFLYDPEQLRFSLERSGFSGVLRRPNGYSDHKELVGLETREDSRLCVEAYK